MRAMARKKNIFKEARKYFKIFLHLQKIGIMTRTAYKVNFLILSFAVFLQVFFSLFFVKIIFGFLDNIAGWGYFEALIVVATYMLVDGIMWNLFAHFSAITRHVRDGTLDGILVKPIDSQFLVSVWRGDLEDVVRIIAGIGVLVYAVNNLSISGIELVINSILYVFLVFNALVIVYSINVIFKSIVFWLIEGMAFYHLTDSFFRMAQYPSDIFFHKIVKTAVLTVFPLAFIATVPAKILAAGFNFWLVVGSFFVAGIFFIASRKFWLFALKNYSSASS